MARLGFNPSEAIAAELIVTGTATAGTGVTVTLPAVAGQYHYITFLEVTLFAAALLSAAATPVLVTTTNVPGSLVLSMSASAQAQGAVEERLFQFENPVRSSAQGVATTIVAPGTTNVIWRINCHYYTAP